MAEHTKLGSHLALTVGIGSLAGAGILAVTGGERVFVVILVLVGASALSGWLKPRRASSPT